MKTTVRCGACKTDVDLEEGMRIVLCMAPLGAKHYTHSLAVDPKTDEGAAILDHFDNRTILGREQ